METQIPMKFGGSPALVVVDDFYDDPDTVRTLALAQPYHREPEYYKGERSTTRFLWPWLKEDFEQRLGLMIVDWPRHNANGVFQKTTADDPLVWHQDSQSYAAAIYLNPGGLAGTSFWRHVDTMGRRGPIPSEEDLLSGDNWTLMDRVGGLYNRLVIWDARLIHSATSYEGFTEEEPRLVQLFFFDTASWKAAPARGAGFAQVPDDGIPLRVAR